MSVNYTVLKSSIIHSTIWSLPSDWRVVWITLLAMRNKDGEIYSSVPGLARAALVSPEETKAALDCFLSPDPESTTPEHEGRRLEVITGGWRLLNHEKVKAEAATANRANYMARYMKDRRNYEKHAKSLGLVGEAEFMAALKRGDSPEILDAITTKHLPKAKP